MGDHAEAIEIDYDPALVAYEELLELFAKNHDPHRGSWSPQYRAALFYHDDEQRRAAEEWRRSLVERHGKPVHTEISRAGEFTRAEDYHQKFRLQNTPGLRELVREVHPEFGEFVDSTLAARLNGYLGGAGTRRELEAELERLDLPVDSGARLIRALAGVTR